MCNGEGGVRISNVTRNIVNGRPLSVPSELVQNLTAIGNDHVQVVLRRRDVASNIRDVLGELNVDQTVILTNEQRVPRDQHDFFVRAELNTQASR